MENYTGHGCVYGGQGQQLKNLFKLESNSSLKRTFHKLVAGGRGWDQWVLSEYFTLYSLNGM